MLLTPSPPSPCWVFQARKEQLAKEEADKLVLHEQVTEHTRHLAVERCTEDRHVAIHILPVLCYGPLTRQARAARAADQRF